MMVLLLWLSTVLSLRSRCCLVKKPFVVPSFILKAAPVVGRGWVLVLLLGLSAVATAAVEAARRRLPTIITNDNNDDDDAAVVADDAVDDLSFFFLAAKFSDSGAAAGAAEDAVVALRRLGRAQENRFLAGGGKQLVRTVPALALALSVSVLRSELVVGLAGLTKPPPQAALLPMMESCRRGW